MQRSVQGLKMKSTNCVDYSLTATAWLQVILQERFGQSFTLKVDTHGCWMLSFSDTEPIITFTTDRDTFNRADSNLECTNWDATAEGWTSILGLPLPAPGAASLPSPLITATDQGMHMAYDLLGLTYWILSRQEEVGRRDLDDHDRFPATSSHAYKHGYLERPVVDEWLYILEQVIQRTWPGIVLKKHSFRIKVSHDVDQPSLYAFKSWSTIARMMAGHLIKRHDVAAFFTAPYVKLASTTELIAADPYNTFDWLMDVSEKNNLQSAFYFICGRSNPVRDADYEPGHPIIRKLMRRIHERGHEIGLHPSYETFKNPKLLKGEFDHLKRVCADEGIQQTEWGGRMHYLRWHQPTTMNAWSDAGLSYDCTLGYADRPGFRCGTCHEYPGFDPVRQQQLSLRIRPLVAMECSVIDESYAGLGLTSAATEMINTLKKRCALVNGVFVLLWHNSYLQKKRLPEMYIEACATL